MTRGHGVGIEWLARHSGHDPDTLIRSASTLLAALATAVADIEDDNELAELRARIEDAPSPAEAFLGRVARILRDEADRLRP